MQRTYLAALGLGALLAGGSALILEALPAAQSAVLFESRAVDASRFVILARPVARTDWSLLVLEQLKPAPACWNQRPDGLMDASLTRFDFTGICGRYIDSNGYSLRVGEEDLANRYRLQLRQSGQELRLLGSSPDASQDLLLGRGWVKRRDRHGFVVIALENGWQLRRRVYGGQTLSHMYFANEGTLAQLASRTQPTAQSSARPGSVDVAERGGNRGLVRAGFGGGPVSLRVIPFRE